MLVLSADTSQKSAGVCLVRGETELGRVVQTDFRTHSVKLLPQIQALLAANNVRPEELELITVTTGPGSFTGLRIAAATAKMLAFAASAYVAGVNTLDALAASAVLGNPGLKDRPVIAMIDARNKRVYARAYLGKTPLCDAAVDKASAILSDGSDIMSKCAGICSCGSAEELKARIAVCGDVLASRDFDDVLSGFSPSKTVYPDPYAVALAGLEAFGNESDKTLFAPEKLRLDYMKDWY